MVKSTRKRLEDLLQFYTEKTGEDLIRQITNPNGRRYEFKNGLVLSTSEAYLYMMGVIDGMRRIDSTI